LARIYKETNRRQAAEEAYRKGLALPADITPEERADFVDRLEKSKKGKKKKSNMQSEF
jgi:hypothetical protein